MKFDLKTLSKQQLGILTARVCAAASWKNDDNLSQTEILEASEPLLRKFYEYAQIKNAATRDINQEWIGDMDPRQTKRGRKKKIISEIDDC